MHLIDFVLIMICSGSENHNLPTHSLAALYCSLILSVSQVSHIINSWTTVHQQDRLIHFNSLHNVAPRSGTLWFGMVLWCLFDHPGTTWGHGGREFPDSGRCRSIDKCNANWLKLIQALFFLLTLMFRWCIYIFIIFHDTLTSICILHVMCVYATGVINDPVEFAIFAYVDTWAGLGGWGWGWWRFFHLHTSDMLRTWRFLHLHTCDMLRKWWAGLGGWGGDDDVSITCTHVTCYALDVSCTCTHVTCYVLDVSCTCTGGWGGWGSLQSGTLKLDWQGLKR